MTSQSPKMSRATFLKITALGGLALGLGIAGQRRLLEDGQLSEVKSTRFLMGTIIHLSVISDHEQSAQRAIDRAFGEMERLIAIFDHRNSRSVLAQLNTLGRLENAPVEMLDVLNLSRSCQRLTDGAFDPAVLHYDGNPTHVQLSGSRVIIQGMAHLSLDGIAKGWIVDRAVEQLVFAGFKHTLVEAGGDVMTSTPNEVEDSWRVGIQHPRDRVLIGKKDLRNRAIATSGDYHHHVDPDYHQHHIIDPTTGQSPQHFASVSVVAPNAALADALATALMVMDFEKGYALVQRLRNIEALWIRKDLEQIQSAGFWI